MLERLTTLLARIVSNDPKITEVERFVELHDQGLKRVLNIVDGTAGYDQLIAEQIDAKYIDALTEAMPLIQKRKTASRLAQKDLTARPRRLLNAAYGGFVCDGKTKNNLREFDYFDRICSALDPRLKTQNYSVNKMQVRAARPDASERDLIAQICASVAEFYQTRDSITPGLVNQQITYSTHFINFLRALSARDAVLPGVFVQANDHWPARVARSMVMKGLGVPRVYLQHAEVTGAFPPLDFEYSILRNQRSLETYSRIGGVSGQTFVIGRDLPPEGFEKRLTQNRTSDVCVVIYPTARILRDRLLALLKILNDNPLISSVIVKRHPRALPLELDDSGLEQIRIVDEISLHDQIAIVGNSSVALELLAQGIPVYQNFDFDPITEDYYGFVRSGLTKTVQLDMLQGQFWTPYDINEAWRSEFEKWIPGREKSEEDLRNLVLEMAKLVPLPR